MIQQRLSRTLQLLARQQRQCHSISRTPFASQSFSQRAIAPSISQRIAGRRWYSQAQEAEAESKKEEIAEVFAKDAAKDEQKPTEEPAKEDPVQKELEAKKKEVTELTVCLPSLQQSQ